VAARTAVRSFGRLLPLTASGGLGARRGWCSSGCAALASNVMNTYGSLRLKRKVVVFQKKFFNIVVLC
jgi:hypothetical protein